MLGKKVIEDIINTLKYTRATNGKLETMIYINDVKLEHRHIPLHEDP